MIPLDRSQYRNAIASGQVLHTRTALHQTRRYRVTVLTVIQAAPIN